MQIARPLRLDPATPVIGARLADGSRVAICGPPAAPSAAITIPPLRGPGLRDRRAERERRAPRPGGRPRNGGAPKRVQTAHLGRHRLRQGRSSTRWSRCSRPRAASSLRHRPDHIVVGEVGGAVARRPSAGLQQPGTAAPSPPCTRTTPQRRSRARRPARCRRRRAPLGGRLPRGRRRQFLDDAAARGYVRGYDDPTRGATPEMPRPSRTKSTTSARRQR